MRLLLPALLVVASAPASEPLYSLDRMALHPYRFTPAYGHASANPGSPRWFAPGYGYVIPSFGWDAGVAYGPAAGAAYGSGHPTPRATTGLVGGTYGPVYSFGRRRAGFGFSAAHPFSSYGYGDPWYHPGATTNLSTGGLWAAE